MWVTLCIDEYRIINSTETTPSQLKATLDLRVAPLVVTDTQTCSQSELKPINH